MTAQHSNYYRATGQTVDGVTRLTADVDTRVCVVGAGFAGLATAVGLLERGVSEVVLVEARRVGHGASGRNGGFVFGGYSLSEPELVKQVGVEQARRLYRLTTGAVEQIRQRVRRYAIDCDWNESGVVLADWFGDERGLRRKQEWLRETLGVDWQWLSAPALRERLHSQRYGAGLWERDAAHFHPLRYGQGLAGVLRDAGVRVFEDSPVKSVERRGDGWQVDTSRGSIRAHQVVIAAGGYIDGLPVPAARAIMPIATYVAVTEPLGQRLQHLMPTPWAVYDTRFAFDYYRPLADGRLLWGGRITARTASRERQARWLRRDMRRVFPDLADVRFDYQWHGLMGYPRHQMPMVGESQPGLWHVIGFGGHGVAPTTALGDLCAAAIAEGDQRYRWFDSWPLQPVFGHAGRLAAQLRYWYLQSRDRIRDPGAPVASS